MTETDSLEVLFYLRRAVARIGESEWMRWWDSNALNVAGDHLLPRIFRRTAAVSAVHIATEAARVQQDAVLPREPRVHLFDLGRDVEAAFERWLQAQKEAQWEPEALPEPGDKPDTVGEALEVVGVNVDALDQTSEGRDNFIVLDEVDAPSLDDPGALIELARRLVAGYAASGRNKLVVPYMRVRS